MIFLRIILCFLIVFSFCGCNNYHLVKDYYYLPIDEAIDIGYPYGGIIYKSDEQNSFKRIIVYGDVRKCVISTTYILVSQEPNKMLYLKLLNNELKGINTQYIKTQKDSLFEFPHGSMSIKMVSDLMNKNGNQADKIADSIIKNHSYYKKILSNKFVYWIICTSSDSLIGPLNKEEFLTKKNELSIRTFDASFFKQQTP